MDELIRRVDRLWKALGAKENPRHAAERFVHWYITPRRHYHNLGHVLDCLNIFNTVKGCAKRPEVVAAAIWFHDAAYDVTKHDNEEQSAILAYETLRAAHVKVPIPSQVSQLIMVSKHTGESLSDDAALFADIDLSILGRSPAQFDIYDRKIRMEYEPSYGREAYNAGRKKILQELEQRDPLFSTPIMRSFFEKQAKENLQKAINAL